MRVLSDTTETPRRMRVIPTLVAAGAVAVFAVSAAAAGPVAARSAGAPVDVIVEYGSGGADTVRDAIARVGGEVHGDLAIIGGVTASVPGDSIAVLRTVPGVRSVTEDGSVRLTGDDWEADDDENSMHSITAATGARDVWQKRDPSGRYVDGRGIGIALIDSGVAPVRGLADTKRVVNGPDLSFESQTPNLRHLDTFGHGTHMAGIILGRDPGDAGAYSYGTSKPSTDPDDFVGMAPGATLINLKVAAADGAADVSQVIAAIDWAVAHRNDPGLNIRVLNLSFGTDSKQEPLLDPLSHAVEAAWRHGIVVLTAAGNEGHGSSRLTMPAQNPHVIAVGAVDGKNSGKKDDDIVADFSARGNIKRRPDLLAPGRSVVSLRVPSSFIDENYPSGRVNEDEDEDDDDDENDEDEDGRFFRGSGTSQATAVMSGAAALLLQQRPLLTPDQVKYLLMSTALPIKKGDPLVAGAGQLDLKAAASAKIPVFTQSAPASKGTGSLEESRGSAHVVDPEDGTELRGEQDIMGVAWDAPTWAASASQGGAWSGGTWNGTDWAGSEWAGSSWAGRTWSGRTWSGRTWSGRTWSGRTWSGAIWSGAGWSGRTWSGENWSGRTWSGRTWSGRTWSGRTWSGRTWSGRTWSGRTWSGAGWASTNWG